MVQDGIFDADQRLGKVQLYLTGASPLRAGGKDMPPDQHPNQQFRIDRRRPMDE